MIVMTVSGPRQIHPGKVVMTGAMQQRIDRLERDRRWWKRLALGLMALSGTFLVTGLVTSFNTRVRLMRESEATRAELEWLRRATQQIERELVAEKRKVKMAAAQALQNGNSR